MCAKPGGWPGGWQPRCLRRQPWKNDWALCSRRRGPQQTPMAGAPEALQWAALAPGHVKRRWRQTASLNLSRDGFARRNQSCSGLLKSAQSAVQLQTTRVLEESKYASEKRGRGAAIVFD